MKFTFLGSLALFAMLLSFAHCNPHSHAQTLVAQEDPISGTWEVSFFVHSQVTPATFVFKLDGAKVTGTANSDHTGPGTVREGTWENGKLNFTLDFQKHESVILNGTLQDSKLVGEFRTEGFVAKWEAKRKP